MPTQLTQNSLFEVLSRIERDITTLRCPGKSYLSNTFVWKYADKTASINNFILEENRCKQESQNDIG